MNSQKQHPNDKLQKSSILFLQLGLVLVLFFVYTALEFESIKKEFGDPPTVMIEPEVTFVTDFDFTIEKKIKQPEKKPYTSTTATHIFRKDEHQTMEPTAIFKTDDSEDPTIAIQIDNLPGGDVLDPEPDEVIKFIAIEEVPIYPGCEGLDNVASRVCFSEKISKFVNRKFNTEIAETLNAQGKQRIWVEFIIDKNGVVTDIRARSTYEQLEKEAIRIVKKLPTMIPGKQRDKTVKVKYALPITFQVY